MTVKKNDDLNDIEIGLKIAAGADSPNVISNVCAICLDDYKEGDSLVRSGAKECPHAFHYECMKEVVCTQANKAFTLLHVLVAGKKERGALMCTVLVGSF